MMDLWNVFLSMWTLRYYLLIRRYNRFAVLACLRSVRNRSRSREEQLSTEFKTTTTTTKNANTDGAQYVFTVHCTPFQFASVKVNEPNCCGCGLKLLFLIVKRNVTQCKSWCELDGAWSINQAGDGKVLKWKLNYESKYTSKWVDISCAIVFRFQFIKSIVEISSHYFSKV